MSHSTGSVVFSSTLLALAGLVGVAKAEDAGVAASTPSLEAPSTVPSSGWPFDGLLEIQAVNSTSACSVAVGDVYTSIYRPKYDTTDTHAAGLSVISKRNGFVIQDKSAGQKFAGYGRYDISGISSRGYPYSKTNYSSYNLAVKFDTTNFQNAQIVIVKGKINDFWTDTGCTVTVRGVYQRRIN